MNTDRYIIAIASTYKQAVFFSRMKQALSMLGYGMIVYTLQYSAYRYLNKQGIQAYIPKKRFRATLDKSYQHNFQEFLDYKSKKMSLYSCCDLYATVQEDLNQLAQNNNVNCFFIWNGSSTEQIAADVFTKNQKISRLFFETANIPGKIFVDKDGVNSQSELYKNINLLNLYPECHKEFCSWKNDYLIKKQNEKKISQARGKYADVSWKSFWDVIGFLYYTHLGFSQTYIMYKVMRLFENVSANFVYDKYSYKDNEFIFFPLQVSYDSQILLNSDIDISDALDYAIQKAKKLKKDLVIKPHPQESDVWVLKKLKNLKKNEQVFIVKDNVFKIIPHAYEVITINSTVGLETMILDKPLEVLGKAIYINFSKTDLEKYIIYYLIDVDYFQDKPILVEQMKTILNRLH